MTCYLGIDPGLVSGAWACINHAGEFVACGDIPHDGKRVQPRALKLLLQEAITKTGDNCEIIIEAVHSMPGQGIASTSAFLRATGCIEAVASLLMVPCHFVSPQVWKRHHGLIKHPKSESLKKARAAWPTAPLKLAKFHNRAEVLLLSLYGLEVRA